LPKKAETKMMEKHSAHLHNSIHAMINNLFVLIFMRKENSTKTHRILMTLFLLLKIIFPMSAWSSNLLNYYKVNILADLALTTFHILNLTH